jgi:hypothetical protein
VLPLLSVSSAIAILLLQAAPASLDLQRLEKYSNAWADSVAGSRLEEQARLDFGGRGVEIANHFLIHTGPRPRNDAFFFVLRAVGDPDTALALIRALPRPPTHESGILDRHFGEIAAAIEAVLTNEATRRDPRIVAALAQSISTARNKPSGSGRHEALEGVRLIGMCRGAEAARVLARFATDPDPEIRTAAASALGQLEPATAAAAADPGSPAQDLLRLLVTDSSPSARRQAADSLGAVEGAAIDAGLRAALDEERDPRVVDGIVQALRRRGTPVDDPGQCRDLIGRTWEAAVAQQMLDCWLRQGISREELVQAALEGPATQRAVALFTLTMPVPLASARSLVVDRSVQTRLFEPPLRDRLLEAAVWVLSQGEAISASTRDTAERALWNLSGRSMDRATAYADRVTPNTARFRASAALARADARAYDATRRPHQAVIALTIALAFGLLIVRRSPLRRPALLLTMSAAGWALWTFQASGVRDLPPPPLQLLSVAALAFFSAGTATGAAALIPRRAQNLSSMIIRFVLALITAAGVAGVICFATRSARLFPSDLEGWELIFDPLGAAILAAAAAAILMAIDRVLPMAAHGVTGEGSR